MDGENSRDLALSGEKKRYQAGMPVVGVNDVRPPLTAGLVGDFCRDAIKERKSKGVVLPLLTILILIRATWPIEKSRAIDQPNRNLGLRQAGFEKPCFAAPKEIPEIGDLCHVRRAFQRLPVSWKNDTSIDSELPQCTGQSGRNIRESPVLVRGYISEVT